MTDTTRDLTFGDTDLDDGDFDQFDDGNATRCTWNESVCVDKPTQFVVFAEHAGGGDAQLFCARHYVLTLAELLELHLPECPGDLNDHILRHGSLDA